MPDPSELAVRAVPAGRVRGVRGVVLRPNQPPEACVYPGDDDPDSLHLAGFLGDELVAITSLYREGHPDLPGAAWRIRGMAVLPQHQGQGFGTRLLGALIEHVRERGGEPVWCNARTRAAEFYAAKGFSRVGGEFEIEGIGPHYIMRLDLNA